MAVKQGPSAPFCMPNRMNCTTCVFSDDSAPGRAIRGTVDDDKLDCTWHAHGRAGNHTFRKKGVACCLMER
jgi:hypothetical protein